MRILSPQMQLMPPVVTTKGELENGGKDMRVPEIEPIIDCHVINIHQKGYLVGNVRQLEELAEDNQQTSDLVRLFNDQSHKV